MTGTRTHLYQRGTFRKCRLTSSRLGFILIVLSFIWGMYLIQVQLNERQSQSEYLKEKIIALSKEYIDAIAKEKGLHSSELGTNGEVEVREMKKATAILLQNMLSRIKNLEKQVENVIINSTSEFQHLTKAIKSL